MRKGRNSSRSVGEQFLRPSPARPPILCVTKGYVPFWRNRTTATVVPATSASQARSRAQRKQKKGYGTIVVARRANPQDARLIRRGVWVRRRRDGSSPQFGVAQSRARQRRRVIWN
jgi:hypothetical protein